MSEKQKAKLELEELILSTLEKQKPESVEELVKIVKQNQPNFGEEIANLVLQLKNENKIFVAKIVDQNPLSLSEYFLSSKTLWYWLTIALASLAMMTALVVPENAYPMAYVRIILGLLLVLFLPGFALTKALFPLSVPIKTPTEYLDSIELFALSLGTSIAITPIVGLILYYSPFKMENVATTFSLVGLVVICASIAVFRGRKKECMIEGIQTGSS